MGLFGLATILVTVAVLTPSPPINMWIMPALTMAVLGAVGMWRSGPFNLRAGLLVTLAIAAQWFTIDYAGFSPIVALIAVGAVLLSACLLHPIWVFVTWAATIVLLVPWAITTASGAPGGVFDSPVFRPIVSYVVISAMIGFGIWAVLHRQARLVHAMDSQRAELRSILENSFDFVVQVDRDRRVVSVNRTAEGTTLEDLIGRPVMKGVVPEDQDRVSAVLDEVFASGIATTHELDVIGFDGERRTLLSRAGPILVDGQVERLTICWTDITEQRSMQQQLLRSQKLEAVGQLTGGVAHDFNNLLTVIRSTLELLNDSDLPFAERRGLLGPAMSAVDRGAELTKRLLAFARQQSLNPTVLQPGHVVAEMVDLLRRTLGESILIDAAANDTWYCKVDMAQLQNAVLNLAINARDAMPEGGRLSITTSEVTVGSEGGTEGSTPGDYVLLAVADTGTGMSPEVVDKAFDPFFTTKAPESGSGLGLSSVYGFVRQSGGYVDIESSPETGTCVSMYLPRVEHSEKPLVGVSTEQPGGRGELVLLVEDDPSVRAVTQTMLETLGYRILVAEDANAARGVLDANPDVSLLLTDVGLPGPSDGIDLCNDVIARRPGLKTLLISGYVERPRDLPSKLLSKPFSKSELAVAVDEALA